MALNSNALTTVDSLLGYMGRPLPDRSQLAVYHDQSVSATACTVRITVGVDGRVFLLITGGANAGEHAVALGANTITALVAAINALAKGFIARVVGTGSASADELSALAATDCFGQGAEQIIRGRDDFAHEQAINAASAKMQKWCNRTFAEATYRQAFNGNMMEDLRLRHFPVSDVSRVSIGRLEGLDISNTSSDSQDATFRLDGTTITLDLHGGANKGTDLVTISTKTIATLATEITALGKGWTASASTTAVGTLPGTELLSIPATQCLGTTATLWIPDQNIVEVVIESDAGIIKQRHGRLFNPFFFHGGHFGTIPPVITPGRVTHFPIWPEGRFNIIVSYTAGYSTIPPDIAHLCNELAASMLRAGMRDSNLSSESVSGYSQSNAPTLWGSEGFMAELAPYRVIPSLHNYEDV